MRDLLLILEDDSGRTARFTATATARFARLSRVHWRDAHRMIADVDALLPRAAIICLDHDLYPDDDAAPDPGDGLDVARHLATHTPCCPVLIHSSNSDRAFQMQGALETEHWRCRRVLPFGDDWIERDWADAVADLLSDSGCV